jgi:hypothetical protein
MDALADILPNGISLFIRLKAETARVDLTENL